MEWRKIPALNEKDALGTSTNAEIDLTPDEIESQLKDKIKLIERIMERY